MPCNICDKSTVFGIGYCPNQHVVMRYCETHYQEQCKTEQNCYRCGKKILWASENNADIVVRHFGPHCGASRTNQEPPITNPREDRASAFTSRSPTLTRPASVVSAPRVRLRCTSPSFIDLLDRSRLTRFGENGISSRDNYMTLLQTPNLWGTAMTNVKTSEPMAAMNLAKRISAIIAGADRLVDLVSLNPPAGHFNKEIMNAIMTLAKVATLPERTSPIVVRFLFGILPPGGGDSVSSWKKSLALLAKQNSFDLSRLHIYVGQIGSAPPTGQTWNHAKIVAADGVNSIVGGHNLWWDAYGSYPPVHDISIEVSGPASKDAQSFVSTLWKPNKGIKLDSCLLTGRYEWKTESTSNLGVENIQANFTSARPTLGRGSRIMTVPQAPHLGVNDGNDAKRLCILNAKHSIRICQQDLVFEHRFSPREDHSVCQWIAQALENNKDLIVQIIVSPKLAGGAKDPYSWGAGASGTLKMIHSFFNYGLSPEARAQITNRLCVVAFAFTAHESPNDFKVRSRTEGINYFWKDTFEDTVYYEQGNLLPAGLTAKKSRPAPANHAKFYLIDDQACYIGSDNMYPHKLIEFGYLIEDPIEVAKIKAQYWDLAWEYSKHNCKTSGHFGHEDPQVRVFSVPKIIEDYYPM